MKRRIRSLVAGAAMAVTVGAGVLAGGGAAFAAGGGGPTPPWESTITGNLLGSLTFYNAQGQVVTGGSLTASGLGAYAVASAPPATNPGYTKATVSVYSPVSGQNPLTWSGMAISSSTNYPNTTAPAPIGTTANPVETNAGTDQPLSAVIAAYPNTQTTAGYVGLYDVRMVLSGPLGLTSSPNYYDTVIAVNTTAGTWSVDYPAYTQNTTTTLAATPASPQTAPASPITLTATVAPAAAGTVSFWSGTTQVGLTQTVTATNGVATVTTTPPTGTTSYQAVYTPVIGSADIGSTSNTLSYVVGVALDNSSTSLAQTGGGGAAGPVTFTGTVTDTTTTTNIITDGTVSLFDNGSATPFATGAVGAGGAYSIIYTYTSAGAHSVVAKWSGDAKANGSSSAAVTFTELAPACTTCNSTATITGVIPAGTISISTPYTATNPLNLGTLALTPAGTYFTASASLDANPANVPTAGQYPNTTFNGITVVDTKSGNLPWTVSALASSLTDGGANPGSTINGQNVGLTNLAPVFVPGNAIVSPDVLVTNQAAAVPPVSPTALGSAGLGGGTPHVIAQDTLQPVGTVGINGTVTLNAPTSTEAGVFVGTITFTIVG